MSTDYFIDFVVTWVNPSDPSWQKEFDGYKCGNRIDASTSIDTSTSRYRDWGLLKYWFRGIDKFAPWIRYVHFVTCGHIPLWLDTDNPKLRIVRHEDYIPAQYLPLFNSNPIELMMHRIPDLSEHFVYFNDDFYLIKPIEPEYFFINGRPCDMAVAKNHHSMNGIILGAVENNMNIIKDEYDIFSSILTHPGLWFCPGYKGFLKLTLKSMLTGKVLSLLDTHAPTPYLKSTFDEVWHKYEKLLSDTMTHRFRSSDDISHWVFRYWQIVKGDISPKNLFATTKVVYRPEKCIDDLVNSIEGSNFSVAVINDTDGIEHIDNIISRIRKAFNAILPEKSSFEK